MGVFVRATMKKSIVTVMHILQVIIWFSFSPKMKQNVSFAFYREVL